MKTEIRIHGLNEIRRAMLQLPQRLDNKLLNKGLLAGAQVVRDEARTRAPILKQETPRRRAGVLRRAISAMRVRPVRYAATAIVRVRNLTTRQISAFKRKSGKGGAANPRDPFYWRFVEFGTSKMAAIPFLRPAFDRKKETAVRVAIATLKPLVEAEIAKLGAASRAVTNLLRVTR